MVQVVYILYVLTCFLVWHTLCYVFIYRQSLVQVMTDVQSLACEESQDQFSENSLSPTIGSDVGFKRAETFSGFDSKPKVTNNQEVTRAWSMKAERTAVKSYNRSGPESAVSTPDVGSPATKHKRKGSGGSGSGWSFRNKNKDDKESTETKGIVIVINVVAIVIVVASVYDDRCGGF